MFRLDSGVHRLRVVEDFAAFPRGAVRVRIGFQPRTATPAPERQQPLPGGHSFTVVGAGANILELFVKHDHIPGIGLIVRQGGPCHVSLDCGDGALATTARREGSVMAAVWPSMLQPARRGSTVGAPLEGLKLHLHRGQSGPQRRVSPASASPGKSRPGEENSGNRNSLRLLGRWRAQGLDRGLPRSPGWRGW